MKNLFIILLCTGIWAGCFAGENQKKDCKPFRISVEGTQFYRKGKPVFIVGGNTPWDKWNDFGGRFDVNFWENHFKALHDLGVNGTRVWIVCDGNSAVKLNADGTVKSISDKFWTDLDQFFEIAKKNEIYIMATMMSFDCTKAKNTDRDHWIAMIKNTNSIQNFIDKYILKFVKRYKDNPYLFSMDLCNEPDWCFEHDSIPWENLSNLFAREAAAIHKNSKILVTVGIAMVKYNSETQKGNKFSNTFFQNLYKNPNAYLDFYSPHHYAWMTSLFKNPFFVSPAEWMSDTSKPIAVGECSAKSCDGHTLAEDYIRAYSHGYAGVFAWTTNGVDRNGGLEEITKGVKGFYTWLATQSVASPKGTEVFQPDWDNIAQHYRFPDWFCDAKFGIFIHWGVYAVPAFGSEWYPRNMYQKDSNEYKHHIKKYGEQTKFGYKDFIPMFKAEKFNADEWAKLFKDAGAKYVVPVAEHHDGFAMFDSELNKWNSVKTGPKKDIIGLLKQAIERDGLVFGLSVHRAENAWFYNGGMNFPSDVQDTTITLYGRRLPNETYNESVAQEWLAHVYELVNKYQPSLIWFDWTVNNPVLMPYFNKFLAYYYNNALDWGKQVVVNTKQGYPTNIQVWDMERGKSGKMMVFPWQTDTSVGKKSWGYIDNEENKTAEQIVHDLIDIVSKNGNLLLNIGPRADGTITEEQKSVLLDIGRWLKINGDAIYETRCWKKSGEGSAESTKGSFTDNTATAYTVRDIRFTTKGDDLFAIVLNWDDAGVMIKSLDKKAIADAKILNVQMLGSNEKINWKQTDEGLKLSFPKTKPCEYAYSLKISFNKKVGEHLESEAVNEVMKHGSN